RRTELLRPVAGERLRLVAPGEEGEFSRIRVADFPQPFGGERQRLVPGNLLELSGAARPGPDERRLQSGWRIMLHDAGRALGAQHATIDRMVAVAFDVANLAISQMDIDAAAAGAHV